MLNRPTSRPEWLTKLIAVTAVPPSRSRSITPIRSALLTATFVAAGVGLVVLGGIRGAKGRQL